MSRVSASEGSTPIGLLLGAYTIVAKVGEGGMGEVYRATDARLGRDVAIKILPDIFAQDVDRLARFDREARTLASLNHPNIAHIHGLEERPPSAEAPALRALVMEFVEGDDLSALIRRGPIVPSDAFAIARQIAAALEAAHDQGIIHRDLKPANVKVRADGTVKVLDFGLAKAIDPPGAHGAADPSNSPTLTGHATQLGVVLGTAAYMAPEQARGKPVDKRADVWAFGAVLFEMLTGARAFAGETATDTLAAIVRAEPDWSLLPSGLSPALIVFLKRCLEKDPRRRVPDIATMRMALEGAFDGASPPVEGRGWRSPLVWVPTIVATASLAALAALSLRSGPSVVQQPSARLTIPLPGGAEITSYPAITRDGKTIAYVARQGSQPAQLYLRDLDSFDARVVAGSRGAHQPFFSPDGKWVAFFAQGALQKVEVAGGAPIRLEEATYPFGGTWTADNSIIYVASLNSGLLLIPAEGGPPKQISKPDGASNGYAHVFPQVLPGRRSVLFTFWGRQKGAAVLSLETGEWKMVLATPSFAAAMYDASSPGQGRLLVVDDAAGIRAAPFDPAHPAPTTADALVLDNVYSQLETEGQGWLAVSDNGTAVYAAGNPAKTSLVWMGQDGTITSPLGAEDVYREVSISPDGTRAVVRKNLDLWVQDLDRGTSSPLTSGDNSNILPVWSRDGQRIVFASNRGGDWDIYTAPADGSRPAEVLLKRPADQFPYAFAPDGTLLYTEITATGGRDLWTLAPDGKPSPLRVTRFNEYAAQFSPEAGGPHFIAYTSDESGRPEIYVQSYPAGERRVLVSTGGGVRPIWAPDGRELYFLTGDNTLVAVAMKTDGTFGPPRTITEARDFFIDDRFESYSVSRDGKRLLMIRRDEGSAPRQLNVILNWFGPSGRR
jgi:serine/threonine protein kinase/Tol biopolymer transport system component